MFDVVVITAGVTGALVARTLSKYDLKLCIPEAKNDVATQNKNRILREER